ncbi:MAG: hypothetical protein EZS28_020576 [Streblomastix strix]|uniref:Uncharacterized protein n=1 Tax=Streblomastix strix TaxID=222440 RepID=A0A5J4VMM7_9EUKA|nr:MAG: hypothetical protein EZS28_020576 [Streblomastix strix]
MNVFKQTVLQLIGLWFRQKTRGNEWFLNQTMDQISYSTGFYGRNGEVATPKVRAPFTGRGSAERVVLASSKVIHHNAVTYLVLGLVQQTLNREIGQYKLEKMN